jgi:hypothetical protein
MNSFAPILDKPEVAVMEIVRSQQLRDLLRESLEEFPGDNMQNASFMIEPAQKAAIEELARANRLSQGVILRVIIREWMNQKLNGCAD